MPDATARLALPFIASGQAQKELFHNEALVRLDALVQPAVVALGLNDPPDAPEPGQCWIAGDTPTGAWAGQAHCLAAWSEDGWRFVAPRAGMTVWSLADRWDARFDGAGWIGGEMRVARLLVGEEQVVGAQQSAIADPTGGASADAEARASVSAILVALRAHGLIAN